MTTSTRELGIPPTPDWLRLEEVFPPGILDDVRERIAACLDVAAAGGPMSPRLAAEVTATIYTGEHWVSRATAGLPPSIAEHLDVELDQASGLTALHLAYELVAGESIDGESSEDWTISPSPVDEYRERVGL